MKPLRGKDTQKNRSRDAWLSLGLVGLWLAATVLYAAVYDSPANSIVFLLLVILSLVAAFALAIRSLEFWPARIALILICAMIIIQPIAKQLRPDPFPSFKDQISKGMTIEEVKGILGEPDKSERLAKLVKVPIEFPLYDDEGNRIDRDHLVKAVEGDLMLHFKIRRTTVVVRFDEENRVKHSYEHFDINGR
jgi:hypothetical protein